MKKNVVNIIVLCCRLIIAVVFLFSGFVKAVDPIGSAIKFGDYFTALNISFFQDHTLTLSIFLSAVEFSIGASLLWGSYRKLSSICALMFMLLFTPLTLWLALTNAVNDCGCFGDAISLNNWETFYKNLFLLACSIVLLVYNRYIKSPFYLKIRWVVVAYSFIFSIIISFLGIRHLPILDFRPYKVGTEIKQSMGLNETNEKEYILVYEKNGEKKKFGLNEIPSDDQGWNFVETIVIDHKNEDVSIKDFFITDIDGNDITNEFLSNDTVAFVLLSYDLLNADEENIDKIVELHEIVSEMKLPFYILTSNKQDAISYWTELTGSDFEYIYGDITVIETIVRSNPGLVVLYKDKIIDKINVSDLPEPVHMEEYVDKKINLSIKKVNSKIIILLSFIIYFVPILVLLLSNRTLMLLIDKKRKSEINKD